MNDLISRASLLEKLRELELSGKAYAPMGWLLLMRLRGIIEQESAVEIKTPGDRIRAMIDKELAEMLTIGTGGFFCLECMRITGNECDGRCFEHCLDWLQKPVENDGKIKEN